MNRGSFYWKCAALAVAGYLVLGVVTMLLWNWLVPALFRGPEVTYLQSLGLLALCKIFFWGFHKQSQQFNGPNAYWKHRFQQKLSTLDPDEREAFKQKMKEKWCRWEKQNQEQKDSSID